jgi:hypothetical protein
MTMIGIERTLYYNGEHAEEVCLWIKALVPKDLAHARFYRVREAKDYGQ